VSAERRPASRVCCSSPVGRRTRSGGLIPPRLHHSS
jgi:hypothetical protein